MVVVRLPAQLADQAGGRKEFEVEAPTVAAALRELPIADLLFDERGVLRPLVNVYLDGRDVREGAGIDSDVEEAREIRIVAAIAGG